MIERANRLLINNSLFRWLIGAAFVTFIVMIVVSKILFTPNSCFSPNGDLGSCGDKYSSQLNKIDSNELRFKKRFLSFFKKYQTNMSRIMSAVEESQDEIKRMKAILKGTRGEKPSEATAAIQCKHEYKLIILSQSQTSNFKRRAIVRSTWGDDKVKNEKLRWKVLFLISEASTEQENVSLHYEQELYEDLVFVNTIDDFRNLAIKLKKGLEWVAKYCNFQYIFKTDDDVFVNIPELFRYLNHAMIPKTKLYAGHLMTGSVVMRPGRYDPGPNFSKDVYPQYISGGGIVMSRDVVVKFVGLFKEVPLFNVEDAYLGVVASKAEVAPRHSKLFKLYVKMCGYNKTFVVVHPVKDKDCMNWMFKMTLPAIVQMKFLT